MASVAPKPQSKGVVALLGIVVSLLTALGVKDLIVYFSEALPGQHSTAYNQSLEKLRAELAARSPNINALRGQASEAYQVASVYTPFHGNHPDWKCGVIGAIVNMTDPRLSQATPLEAYGDYKTLPCKNWLLLDAKYDWYGYRTTRTDDPAAASTRMLQVDQVLAEGTLPATKGWVYVGRSEGGKFTSKTILEDNVAVGQTITISVDRGLPLFEEGYGKTDDQNSTIVGFLPSGSQSAILETRRILERVKTGAKSAYFVKARVNVVKVADAGTVAFQPERVPFAVSALAALPAEADQYCGHYPESSSLHGATQRWIYAGEKSDSDAFVAGTSALNAQCVPRDGAVVTLAKDSKVFVGRDPHWPGVAANGQVLSAGTQIQVVGDVSGYPFDATVDPSYCTRVANPEPQQRYVAVPPGHAKHFCVYVPFNPMY